MVHQFSRRIAAAALASLLCGNVAVASTFTGVFSGQGEACWGPLYIRTKTIQWITDFSVCYSPYTIVKKTFVSKPADYDYILYKLNQSHKTCSWRYIGLYYYDFADFPGIENHWSVVGFKTLDMYKKFDFRQLVTTSIPIPEDVLFCSLPVYGVGKQK